MEEVLILSFSRVERDSRVLRQIRYLSQYFSISVIGYSDRTSVANFSGEFVPVPLPSIVERIRKIVLLLLGKILGPWAYELWYWGQKNYKTAYQILSQKDASVIHANDWDSLPVASRVSSKTGVRVVLDLHEYAPLEWENRWYWRVFYQPMIDYFLKKYLPSISASVTVSEGIAKKYQEQYGLFPVTVMNAVLSGNSPMPRKVAPDHIRLVHHGAAIRDRRLELMIQTLAHTGSRYSLHLILVEGSRSYISQLRAMAHRLAPGRIFFHPPVAVSSIVERLSEFDTGVILLPPVNYNHAVALPNKLFEFIAAGLSVCIGPSVEMARLIDQFRFGVVAPSFNPREVAQILDRLSIREIEEMKANARTCNKVVNADGEMSKLIALYRGLTGAR